MRQLLIHHRTSRRQNPIGRSYDQQNKKVSPSVRYVCMYSIVSTFSRVSINRVWLPILLVVSWTGKTIFPCTRSRPRIFTLARQVRPSRPAPVRPVSSLSHAEFGAYSRSSSRFPRPRPHRAIYRAGERQSPRG